LRLKNIFNYITKKRKQAKFIKELLSEDLQRIQAMDTQLFTAYTKNGWKILFYSNFRNNLEIVEVENMEKSEVKIE
jgi:hypothetical protein